MNLPNGTWAVQFSRNDGRTWHQVYRGASADPVEFFQFQPAWDYMRENAVPGLIYQASFKGWGQ